MKNDGLTAEILLKMMKSRKDEVGMTYAEIAEASGVPESTVAKVFNGTNRSPCFDTIVPIAKVLGISLDGGVDEAAREHGQNENDNKILGLYVSLLCCAYEEELRKKDKWIKFLVILLVLILALCMAILIYDYTHLMVGWVRK